MFFRGILAEVSDCLQLVLIPYRDVLIRRSMDHGTVHVLHMAPMRRITEYLVLPTLVGIVTFYLTALHDFNFQQKLAVLIGTIVLSVSLVYILHIRSPKSSFSKECSAAPGRAIENVVSLGTQRKQRSTCLHV